MNLPPVSFHFRRAALWFLLGGLALVRTACADPAILAQDFSRATGDYERALSAADESVNRRYQGDLENLLVRAKRDDDVDTIARVQQALDRLAAKKLTLTSLGPNALYVGAWVYVFHVDGRSYNLDLNADGSCTQDGQRFGSWEVTPRHLVIHYDGHPDWRDRYELPVRDGSLTATNDDGYTMAITRRGVPLTAALQKALLGAWNFRNLTDGREGRAELAPDGGYLVDNGRRAGFWSVSGDMLIVGHGRQDGGRDIYELPVTNGVINGKNLVNHSLRLSRPGVGATGGAGTPNKVAAGPSTWNPAGRWRWHTGPDNTFSADGQVFQRTKLVGRWEWIDQSKGQLRVRWNGGKYVDTMTLQPDGVHLSGQSSNGDQFTEERLL